MHPSKSPTEHRHTPNPNLIAGYAYKHLKTGKWQKIGAEFVLGFILHENCIWLFCMILLFWCLILSTCFINDQARMIFYFCHFMCNLSKMSQFLAVATFLLCTVFIEKRSEIPLALGYFWLTYFGEPVWFLLCTAVINDRQS